MHILPILWSEQPHPADWAALKAAREALGFAEAIQPARCLPGSPGRYLVVGSTTPDWLCDYAHVDSTSDPDLKDALGWCLGFNEYHRVLGHEDLLSRWLGAGVELREEYELDD